MIADVCSLHARFGPAAHAGLGFYQGMRFHIDTNGYREWGSEYHCCTREFVHGGTAHGSNDDCKTCRDPARPPIAKHLCRGQGGHGPAREARRVDHRACRHDGFFLGILFWTIFWLGWNLLAPPRLQFDPPMGFVFWLFISNMIQILLMPLLMIGQNIQGRQSEARAEHDLDVNIKAEAEVETILMHLERQNDMLMAMLEKQGIKLDEALKQ